MIKGNNSETKGGMCIVYISPLYFVYFCYDAFIIFMIMNYKDFFKNKKFMKSLRTIFFPIIYRLAMPLRRFYWYIFQPRTRGVKCLIQKDGKFLLVRLAYAHKSWTVPGGGVKKKESFEEACYREIKEEIGVVLGPILK